MSQAQGTEGTEAQRCEASLPGAPWELQFIAGGVCGLEKERWTQGEGI